MKWIKANKSMPPMFKDVEWRNANGGNIPLGKMSAIEIYKKAGANINSFEWFGESPALAEDGWTTEKPVADREFAMVTKIKFQDNWEYAVWKVVKIDSEEGSYYGLCNGEGEEYCDYEDLAAQFYKII